MIKAVIFDLDGLLIDSEIISYKIYKEILHQFGHNFTIEEYTQNYSGKTEVKNVTNLINTYSLPWTIEKVLDNVYKIENRFIAQGVDLKYGAKELLSYLKDNNLDGEVLHGTNEYIVQRIKVLTKQDVKYKFGIVGKPSDWLIASNVNYENAKRLHNIELIDIPINIVSEYYFKSINDYNLEFNYDSKEIEKALKLHKALNKIKEEYNLNGLTIRCFDLLGTLKTTACMSLSLFNQDGIVATCEGDVPTMISMHILNKITNQVGFQANPSRIDIEKKRMILAHCTLPLNMIDNYKLDTHFESGIGVAIKGYLKEEKITIFKLSKNLKDYYITTGTIIRNLEESNLCRTQIEVNIDDDIEYSYKYKIVANINITDKPYGNHHVIIYGDYKKEIIEYMNKIK